MFRFNNEAMPINAQTELKNKVSFRRFETNFGKGQRFVSTL